MTVPTRHHDTHEPQAGTAMPSLLDSDASERDDTRLRMLASLPSGGQAQWQALLSRRSEPRRKARIAWATAMVVVGAAAVVLVASGGISLERPPAGTAIDRLAVRNPGAGIVVEAPHPSSASLPALVTDAAPTLIDRPATDPWQALAGLPQVAAQPSGASVSEQRGTLTETARIETSPDPVMALARPEPTPATTQGTSQGNAGPPQVSLTPAGGGLGAARPWGRSPGNAGPPQVSLTPAGGGLGAARPWGSSPGNAAGKTPLKANVEAKGQAQGKPPVRPHTKMQAKAPARSTSKVAGRTPTGTQSTASGKARPGPKATPKLASKRPASSPPAVSARRGADPTAAARNDPDVDLIAALIGHMDAADRPARSTGAPAGRADTAAPRQPAQTSRSR